MILVANNFTSGLAGQKMEIPDSAPGVVGQDPGADYRAATGPMMITWREPGALERTLAMPIGDAPGAMGIRIVTIDTMVHTWDLARALGRQHTMDAELAGAALEMLRGLISPEFRGPGRGFDAEVPCPDGAPVQDRLLAFTGRQP